MRLNWIVGFAWLLLCGCSSGGSRMTSSEATPLSPERPIVELLYFDGCPHTQKLRHRLREALTDDLAKWQVREVDLSQLDPADDRLRYGSPTLLVEGQDLFGAVPVAGPRLSCRIYRDTEDGVPTAEQIARCLKNREIPQPVRKPTTGE